MAKAPKRRIGGMDRAVVNRFAMGYRICGWGVASSDRTEFEPDFKSSDNPAKKLKKQQ
jgi:hypothetical protein